MTGTPPAAPLACSERDELQVVPAPRATLPRVTTFQIVASRVILRCWRDEDLPQFAKLNADPEVMEFLGGPMSPEESDAMVRRFEAEFERRGFCPWAVEVRESGEFIGFVGLHDVPAYLVAAPAVEVGWRLAHSSWGRGYATEAATQAISYGFGELGLDALVSFTAVRNLRSRHVMERLGMHRDARDDFEHPKMPEASPLRPHVLYRLLAGEFDPSPPAR